MPKALPKTSAPVAEDDDDLPDFDALEDDTEPTPQAEAEPDTNHPHWPYVTSDAESAKYKQKPNDPVFFDLETVPDHARMESFGLPEVKPLVVASLEAVEHADVYLSLTIPKMEAYWDERSDHPCEEWCAAVEQQEAAKEKPREGVAKLVKKLRDRRSAAERATDDRRKLLSVTPEYCRIVAVGVAGVNGSVATFVDTGEMKDWEQQVLTLLWRAFHTSKPIVGFNIARFDLPVVFVRSAILGVDAKRRIDMTPWKGDVIDLYQARFPRGNSGDQPGKLKELAPLMGIPVPAGDVDGSQVETLWREHPAKLREYVASDVAVTRELWRKYRYFFC